MACAGNFQEEVDLQRYANDTLGQPKMLEAVRLCAVENLWTDRGDGEKDGERT